MRTLAGGAAVTPALLLWSDAGRPTPAKRGEPYDGPCYLCGEPSPTGTAVRVRDALGPSFTDHDQAADRRQTHVCVPCVWLLGGKPPDTFRLWSVVYRADRLAAPSNPKATYPHGPHTHCTSKSDVSEIVDVLLDPPSAPWVCSVADSGQIHILPWSRVNLGDEWEVLFERQRICSDSRTFAGVLYHASALLAAGYIREDVETLDPHPSKLVKHGRAVWATHARPLQQWRRSGLLALAIALTRKESYADLRDRCAAIVGADSTAPDGDRAGARDDGIGDDGKDQAGRLVAAREVGIGRGVLAGRGLVAAGIDDGAQAPNRDAARGLHQGALAL